MSSIELDTIKLELRLSADKLNWSPSNPQFISGT